MSAHAVPSIHRRALITWVAVYPTITIVLALLRPVLKDVPLVLQTLILTAIAIPIVVYVLVPALMKANARLTARRSR
ncbi:hypothetical protein [Streptomyces sp. ISL-94]|uniref:hypothetical protein n=1 Tax=Streptomyces sp. ISL-94 TaxID=2819190 RepID=UPI001BEB55D2|nr:hypothetical protein [Streptomyces sp. ISL-94]MBT2478920.1 hypothetical protein [Streptomyces sp. ISL-94]